MLDCPTATILIPPKCRISLLMNGNEYVLNFNPDQTKLTKLYLKKRMTLLKKNSEKNPFSSTFICDAPCATFLPGSTFRAKSRRGLYGMWSRKLTGLWVRFLIYLQSKWIVKKITLVWFYFWTWTLDHQGRSGGPAGLFAIGKGSTWEVGQREPSICLGGLERSLPGS